MKKAFNWVVGIGCGVLVFSFFKPLIVVGLVGGSIFGGYKLFKKYVK
jgi:hypothetical protein